jgi:hypothetical protein
VTTSGGPAVLVVRAARFLDQPSRTRVFVAGADAGDIVAQPGGYRVHRLAATVPAGPVRLELLSEDPELGIAVDWLRLEDLDVRVAPSVLGARLLPLGVTLVLLLAGARLAHAAAGGALVLLVECAWAARDPFGCAHVAARVALPAVALGALAALLVRGRPGGRWVAAAFVASHLLKGAAVFHPSYFYNDVRNNHRYVAALKHGAGSLAERNLEAQVKVGVAYPRIVGGRAYAFPYSPLFFIPFGWLPPAGVVEAMKHVAAAAAAAEVVVVFFLARSLGSPGVFAAALAALLPPLHSRLLLAMWSTVAGHLLDSLVVLSAMHLAAPGFRAWLRHAGLLLLALLTYISSLFNLGLFTPLQAALQRRCALRLLALLASAAGITVAWLYGPFVATFFREIVPALAGTATAAPADAAVGPLPTLRRLVIFYGYALPLLAGAGVLLLRRRADPERASVLAAYAGTFAALVALRAFSGGLFKDLKEIEFASPLVALGAGATLEALSGRGREGAAAAVLAFLGLAVFCLGRYADYLGTYTALVGLR